MITTRNALYGILFPMGSKIGTWLKQEREKRGLTQSSLAKLANVNRATINKIENDLIQPGTDTLIAIAKGLKVPPEVIFRAADILPESTINEQQEELLYLFNQLPDQEKRSILRFIRATLDAIEKDH